MTFLRILSLLFFIGTASLAQASPSFEPDVSNYIDDNKLETPPLNAEEKEVQKALDARKAASQARKDAKNNTSSNRKTTRNSASSLSKRPTKPVESDNTMLFAIIAVLVLIGGVVVVLVAKKGKKNTPISQAPAQNLGSTHQESLHETSSHKVENPTAQQYAQGNSSVKVSTPAAPASPIRRPQVPQTPAPTPPVESSENEETHGITDASGPVDIATATRVDNSGRNPSGIIIDEDKYFASKGKATENFVDEDFVK